MDVCFSGVVFLCFFFFKQKTAYEMRISDWSSDVCSSDLTVNGTAMVKHFLMNLLLAFTWVALTGVLYYSNFLFGFAVGFFLLWLMNRNETDRRYFNVVPTIIGFILYFLYEMVKDNIQGA